MERAKDIAAALEKCDWSGTSIGHKTLLSGAIEVLKSHDALLSALELLLAVSEMGDEYGYVDGHGWVDADAAKGAAMAAISIAKGGAA